MIAGIDLASAPANTGVAQLRTSAGRVVVDQLAVGASDADLLAVSRAADHTGVDVPTGWPRAFVTLISGHHHRGAQPTPPEHQTETRASAPDAQALVDDSWRRTAILRSTDRWLQERTGLRPLSVSSDRIAYPALRWAALEAVLRAEGVDCSRDGSGRISEAYPAGALHAWRLPHRSYKGSAGAAVRERIITGLTELAPWLDWNGHTDLAQRDDNALDAVLAALVAREVTLGAIPPPPPELQADALAEGWIMVPMLSRPTLGPTAP